ncbi:MMPL family transporter [Cytobacillus spongiae]|uniref:MMPL family transporter n=1 Tax=Cytobacillus spongiae TaxID=2901381 RepID=UPI001F25A9BE|nr:MMPL family transporter [Cytobacillus spongiae]UII56353.1 MMPL family transporter [Cytobacillus spongiae]
MIKWGNGVYRFRKIIIIIWVLVIGFFSFYAVKLPSVLGGNGFEYDGEFRKTKQILQEDFNQAESSIILFFEKEAEISDEKFKTFIGEHLEMASELEVVDEAVSPLNREDMLKKDMAYAVLNLNKGAEEVGDAITELREGLRQEEGMKVQLTGEPVIVKDLNQASQDDLAKAEMIGLPIALVVLLLAFGGLIAAGIPLVIGVVTILTSMGITYFMSYQMDLSIFILNIVPMIGLALSIDFALLVINRFKEEINNRSIQEAVAVTVATAGRSIIFSGLCVFIGLSGLLFIQIDIFQNVAVGGMSVVFVSVLAAITLLPAILGMLGKKINSLSVLKMNKKRATAWESFAKLVMKRPVMMAILGLTILIGGLLPVKDMNLSVPGTEALPPNYESRVAFDAFEKAFIEENRSDANRVVIVAEGKGEILDSANLEDIDILLDDLHKEEIVDSIESIYSAFNVEQAEELSYILQQSDSRSIAPAVEYYTSGEKMLLHVYLNKDESTSSMRKWVSEWKTESTELEIYLGGQIKFEQEIFDEIFEKAPYGLALILISTFLILMVAFRSLLIPIKAIIMNILSLTATFGIVVWIFQGGHFGIEATDIALVLPVFVFSLVFGLSMDYEVFLISRIHEVYNETLDNTTATLKGLTSTSKIITSAALIMIVVTGAFAFTGVMPVKQMGVGIALAIFVDATIVRMVLVPALMKLLGDWNWWFFGFKHKKAKEYKQVS